MWVCVCVWAGERVCMCVDVGVGVCLTSGQACCFCRTTLLHAADKRAHLQLVTVIQLNPISLQCGRKRSLNLKYNIMGWIVNCRGALINISIYTLPPHSKTGWQALLKPEPTKVLGWNWNEEVSIPGLQIRTPHCLVFPTQPSFWKTDISGQSLVTTGVTMKVNG